MTGKFVLYAPNVHTGGGFVLLRTLLSAWPKEHGVLTAFLDVRARGNLTTPDESDVFWVEATAKSRLNAELGLLRTAGQDNDVILCFHGLPPLLASRAKIIVFQQNRNYLGLNALSAFAWKTRLRLLYERMLSRLFRKRVSKYIVQTTTMRRELLNWYGADGLVRSQPDVQVLPFMEEVFDHDKVESVTDWDFIYVADGEAHKNHGNLLAAWTILAQEGLRPSLALTLSARDETLRSEIDFSRRSNNLQITDLGQLPRDQILTLYSRAGALIFPSTSESFGLPLIEAMHLGRPIVAGELDFVRDVCVPSQTFNPESPISIARAVKRHLGVREEILRPNSAGMFWDILLQKCKP